MARPRTAFDRSPQSTIFHEIERFAIAHGGQVPSPYRLWRQMRSQGSPLAWSTFYYHWQSLVSARRLMTRNGVYWLPARQPRHPSTTAPLQLQLGF